MSELRREQKVIEVTGTTRWSVPKTFFKRGVAMVRVLAGEALVSIGEYSFLVRRGDVVTLPENVPSVVTPFGTARRVSLGQA